MNAFVRFCTYTKAFKALSAGAIHPTHPIVRFFIRFYVRVYVYPRTPYYCRVVYTVRSLYYYCIKNILEEYNT